MDNYDSVLEQLAAFGLDVQSLTIGKLQRCRHETDRQRQRTGWYSVHQVSRPDGGSFITGAYGCWREGADPETGRPVSHKIKYKLENLDASQRAALKARVQQDRLVAEAARAKEAERAAVGAQRAWKALLLEGDSEYLRRKKVGAHGVRFSARGNLVIPVTDTAGKLHGLQIIYGDPAAIAKKGRDKDFWPVGLAKRGHFHMLGTPGSIVLMAEGYATGASIHEATGYAVAVAFDAGNLVPVAIELRKRYPSVKILVCGDDDFKTLGNPGATAAEAAATACKGAWTIPVFADRGDVKLTDFNDLAATEGPFVVRAQLVHKLSGLGWLTPTEVSSAGNATKGGGGPGDAGFQFDLDRLLRQFTLIYTTDTAFDDGTKRIIGLGPLRSAAGKALVREWLEHPGRETVLPESVVFDPTEKSDPATTRNLWGGWPTVPRSGCCEKLLDLLMYLCDGEGDRKVELWTWILKWLAYPIQNPGAKMQTALLMHGPEGTGKNTFFAVVREIYGKYGCQFSQTELESQFNGWASGKLFGIGNEVVSRAELYHMQGRLKNMITEPEWMINEKQLPSRQEANHCNFVFFSNRVDIAKLDPEDRRYCVVWTPPSLDVSFYNEVRAEIDAGGSAALHDYLLHLDLGDFKAHTRPPLTGAKKDLIELGMDSTERFWTAWLSGQTTLPVTPCLFDDFFAAYRVWCGRVGIPKFAPAHVLRANTQKRGPTLKSRASWEDAYGAKHQNPVVIPDPAARPPDLTESAWLSPHIEAFKDAVDRFRLNAGVRGDENG